MAGLGSAARGRRRRLPGGPALDERVGDTAAGGAPGGTVRRCPATRAAPTGGDPGAQRRRWDAGAVGRPGRSPQPWAGATAQPPRDAPTRGTGRPGPRPGPPLDRGSSRVRMRDRPQPAVRDSGATGGPSSRPGRAARSGRPATGRRSRTPAGSAAPRRRSRRLARGPGRARLERGDWDRSPPTATGARAAPDDYGRAPAALAPGRPARAGHRVGSLAGRRRSRPGRSATRTGRPSTAGRAAGAARASAPAGTVSPDAPPRPARRRCCSRCARRVRWSPGSTQAGRGPGRPARAASRRPR